MIYHVHISAPALMEIDEAYEWIKGRAPKAADRWYDRLMAAIDSLSELPNRCGPAPESEAYAFEVRQLLFGKRSGTFRILFRVHENQVRILHVRRGSRRFLA